MVKHTQTIHRLLPMNCLIVFDHFVGLALKGLTIFSKNIQSLTIERVQNTHLNLTPTLLTMSKVLATQKNLPVQSQQKKHCKKVWNMFKINNKDSRTTSILASVSFSYRNTSLISNANGMTGFYMKFNIGVKQGYKKFLSREVCCKSKDYNSFAH